MGVPQIRRCTVLSIYEQYRALRGPYHIPVTKYHIKGNKACITPYHSR